MGFMSVQKFPANGVFISQTGQGTHIFVHGGEAHISGDDNGQITETLIDYPQPESNDGNAAADGA